MGMVQSLGRIIDHPKIDMDPDEYDRIRLDRKYLEGDFDKVHYYNTYGEKVTRPYVGLNMMQVIVRRMASLLYNEQSKISVDTSDTYSDGAPHDVSNDPANVFIQGVLGDNDFNKNFEYYLESELALGGLAIRPYVDQTTGKIKLSWVQAPTFFPLRSNTNAINSAAIATKSQRTEAGAQAYYTLLEFHEWAPTGYTITNELYRSTQPNVVGDQVPLSQLYPDLTPTAQLDPTLFTRPLFVYIKPAGFNNRNISSPLGVGIADNALTTLKQINDAYDQFNWEVEMGQRRVIVPERTTHVEMGPDGDTGHQVFDPNQNVFIGASLGMDSETIQDLTTDIRSQEYIDSLNQFLKTLEMQVGLSVGTFSFDATGLKTATEVVSENSMTYQTRNSHLTMIERGIKELVVSICELAAGTVYNGKKLYSGPIPTVNQVTVDFDDGVFTDKSATADYWIKLQAAGLVPRYIAMSHVLGITEDQAKDYIAEMGAQSVATTPTPNSGLFGDTDSGTSNAPNDDSGADNGDSGDTGGGD